LKKTNFHQPAALPFLFLTEMWERFGFYTVQGLLIIYMTQYFHFPDNQSYTILGIFTALAYISPLAGGFLANRILSYRIAIFWGGLFLAFGYFLLALPYPSLLFYPALAVIVVGNGLFKPNISSLLGTQYLAHDPRRESGFTIFYIGINIGIVLSGCSGYVKDVYGWRASFALASIGLLIGLITFYYGWRFIKDPQANLRPRFQLKLKLFIYCLLAIAGVNLLLNVNEIAIWLLPCIGLVLLVYLTVLTLQQTTEYKQRMLTLNILIISSIVFWTLFLQLFYSANLFVERLVEKNLFGIPLTTTVFYASQGLFIIILGPFFAWLWHALSHKNKNPALIHKFMFGIFFAGLSFLVLSMSTLFPNAAEHVHPLWIFTAYFLVTIGELCLSPIGLSAVTTLAPRHLVGFMMGVWFVATGFGGILAGWIAKLSSVPDEVTTPAGKLLIYQFAFLHYAYLAFIVAIFLFFLQMGMKRIYSQV
jgi:POT family proton-dependent oligopeptide transporter